MEHSETIAETPPHAAAADKILIRDLSKAFAGVQALDRVSMDLEAGRIHALCGENGAGKSTLIKILAGVYSPDAGHLQAWGSPLRPGSVPAAEKAGIAVIHQEPTAFPQLNAVDNIFVGREPRRFGGLLLDRRRMLDETRHLLHSLHADVDPRLPVGHFSVAQRQLISIARALSHRCRLLILDEPTSSLSGRETEVLFDTLRRLREDGVAILYVSHRLEEVFSLADTISVLRDGALVARRPAAELDRDALIRLMVGRQVDVLFQRQHHENSAGEPRLQLHHLTRRGAFADISLTVHGGEIVGLAGLVGAGRSELARCIMGLDRADGGTVELDGVPLPKNQPRTAIRRGLAMVAEDRQREGLVPPLSVRENLCMVSRRTLATGFWRRRGEETEAAERMVERLAVKTAGIAIPAESLSGGNQQKVVLGKWLDREPNVLILDEPTRGVDVGAKAEIHRLILRLAEQGMAILLISSELPEILTLADRILVMREGHLAGTIPGATATQERILDLALPDSGRAHCHEEAAP